MGHARQAMDRITEAVMRRDADALRAIYAEDAVADTPDEGRLTGRDAIVNWMMVFAEAFPDTSFEMISKLEVGDTAVDEGYLIATHTGTLRTPEGDVEPTGRRVRIRECDICSVRGAEVVSHRFYFDQMDMLGQLGLVDTTLTLPDARTDEARV